MDYQWFRDRKAELKLKDAQIAEAAAKDRSVINKVINGAGSFSLDRADQLAALFKVTRIDMLFRIGVLRADDLESLDPTRRQLPAPANDDDVVEITSLDLSLSMGPGTLIEDFVETTPIKMGLGLIQAITRTPSDRLRLVKGIGDSMEPTLRTGDTVMVDINERALTRISGIYWIDYAGSHGIKRLRPAGKDRVLIISDNTGEDNFEVPAEDLRIEGRVIWFARDL